MKCLVHFYPFIRNFTSTCQVSLLDLICFSSFMILYGSLYTQDIIPVLLVCHRYMLIPNDVLTFSRFVSHFSSSFLPPGCCLVHCVVLYWPKGKRLESGGPQHLSVDIWRPGKSRLLFLLCGGVYCAVCLKSGHHCGLGGGVPHHTIWSQPWWQKPWTTLSCTEVF